MIRTVGAMALCATLASLDARAGVLRCAAPLDASVGVPRVIGRAVDWFGEAESVVIGSC